MRVQFPPDVLFHYVAMFFTPAIMPVENLYINISAAPHLASTNRRLFWNQPTYWWSQIPSIRETVMMCGAQPSRTRHPAAICNNAIFKPMTPCSNRLVHRYTVALAIIMRFAISFGTMFAFTTFVHSTKTPALFTSRRVQW